MTKTAPPPNTSPSPTQTNTNTSLTQYLTQAHTEQPSPYRNLHKLSIPQILEIINCEDQRVPLAVAHALPQIAQLAQAIENALRAGGRLFYIGTGTSGRLGILDAAECPPTFGVPPDLVIGVIAGGTQALLGPVEFAEDNYDAGWHDLQHYEPEPPDIIIGISASGRTPYTVGAIHHARQAGLTTGCITCSPGSPLAQLAHYPVEVNVGAEVVSGSTRMKAGTAQKLILNMLSTTVMIRLGHIDQAEMIDLKPLNQKLIWRGSRIIAWRTGIPLHQAQQIFLQQGSVRKAITYIQQQQQQQQQKDHPQHTAPTATQQ